MRLFVAACACFVALTSAGGAHAQGELAIRPRLAYSAPDACPDAQGFRDRIVARLGYDPFDAAANEELRVIIDPAAQRARIELGEGSGRDIGPASSCAELVSAAATTASILLDPIPRRPDAELPPAPSPPEPPVHASPPRVVAPPVIEAPRPDPSNDVQVAIALDLGATVGAAPEPSFAGAVLLGAQLIEAFRIELGARMRHSVASIGAATDPARLSTWSGVIAPCAAAGIARGCLDFELGAHEGDGSPFGPSSWAWHAALGVRLGAEVPVASGLALRASVGGWVPLTRVVVSVEGNPVWESSTVFGSLDVGVVFFPGAW